MQYIHIIYTCCVYTQLWFCTLYHCILKALRISWEFSDSIINSAESCRVNIHTIDKNKAGGNTCCGNTTTPFPHVFVKRVSQHGSEIIATGWFYQLPRDWLAGHLSMIWCLRSERHLCPPSKGWGCWLITASLERDSTETTSIYFPPTNKLTP